MGGRSKSSQHRETASLSIKYPVTPQRIDFTNSGTWQLPLIKVKKRSAGVASHPSSEAGPNLWRVVIPVRHLRDWRAGKFPVVCLILIDCQEKSEKHHLTGKALVVF